MLSKIFGKLLSGVIMKMVLRTLKDSNLSVDVGKLKIILPITVKGIPAGMAEDKINGVVNNLIDMHIEPKLKNAFDLGTEIKIEK